MIKLFKKIIICVLYCFGINFLVSLFLKHKIYVINFHSVCSSNNKDILMAELYPDLSIDVEKFEKRIKYLIKRGHNFIKFDDLFSLRNKSKRILKPTILYFDDGFKDNLLNALPILLKYKIPATIFISTGLIDRLVILWSLKHRYYLLQKSFSKDNIENEINRLKKMPVKDREQEIKKIYKENNFSLNLKNLNIFLSWQDVSNFIKNGMEIGSHGVLHSNLKDSNDVEIRYEIEESKNIIKNKIGLSVKAFSCPYGRYDSRVFDLFKKNGYSFIVSSGLGLNDMRDLKKEPIFLNNVVNRSNDSMIIFKVNLYSGNLIRNYK